MLIRKVAGKQAQLRKDEMGRPSVTRIHFLSPDAKFALYNFHRQSWQVRAAELLASGGGPSVVLLSGPPGIGRRYFLEAVAHQVRDRGDSAEIVTLDLDGYEPDKGGLAQYVEHQLAKRQADDEEERAELLGALRQALQGAERTIWKASVFSLLFSVGDLARAIQALRGDEVLPGPRLKESEILPRWLEELSRGSKLVVHVPDHTLLTEPLRRRLIQESERLPDVLLGLSCSPADETGEVAGWAHQEPLRFEFRPLQVSELREVLDKRFRPNSFPDGLAEALWRYSKGRPGLVAAKVYHLVHGDALLENRSGTWHLPKGGLSAPAVVRQFASDFNDSLNELVAAVPDRDLQKQIRWFLFLAALCGANVPADLLADHLALPQNDRDALIDWIDDQLASEGDASFFLDLQYSHPSFPGHSIYQFQSPLLSTVVLEQLPSKKLRRSAQGLLQFLRESLPARSRGAARLFLNLLDHLPDQDREPYLLDLAYWVGREESDELGRILKDLLQQRRLDPEVLWRVVEGTRDRWPPHRRWAVLEAYIERPDGIPLHQLGNYHYIRADIQQGLGRPQEALQDAERALEFFSKPVSRLYKSVPALLLAGQLLRILGNPSKAKARLEEALKLALQHDETDHRDIVDAQSFLAMALRDLGELQEARHLASQALQLGLQSFGADDPIIIHLQHVLALALQDLGKHQEARPLVGKALESAQQVVEPFHPSIAMYRAQLGRVLRAAGELQEACLLVRKTLESALETLEQDHPSIAVYQCDLALILMDLGELQEARLLLHQALDSAQRVLGLDHPDVSVYQFQLSKILRDLGELRESRQLASQALELAQQCFEPDHPYIARCQSGLAMVLRDLGELREACHLLHEALETYRKKLRPGHPRITQAQSRLATVMQDQGQPSEAHDLLIQALDSDQRNFEPDHPQIARHQSRLAMVLRDLGEIEKARDLLDDTHKSLRDRYGSSFPLTRKVARNLKSVEDELSSRGDSIK